MWGPSTHCFLILRKLGKLKDWVFYWKLLSRTYNMLWLTWDNWICPVQRWAPNSVSQICLHHILYFFFYSSSHNMVSMCTVKILMKKHRQALLESSLGHERTIIISLLSIQIHTVACCNKHQKWAALWYWNTTEELNQQRGPFFMAWNQTSVQFLYRL